MTVAHNSPKCEVPWFGTHLCHESWSLGRRHTRVHHGCYDTVCCASRHIGAHGEQERLDVGARGGGSSAEGHLIHQMGVTDGSRLQ